MYLDSAILVKLLVHEPDSLYYAGCVDGQIGLVSSQLALTEVWSALLRKERQGALDPQLRRGAWAKFRQYERSRMLELLPVSGDQIERANFILERCHPSVSLRSLDALHLAAAESVAAWPLVSNDERMRAAANLLRMPLVPLPEDTE
jgi:predicted nucleic acid-binding protein